MQIVKFKKVPGKSCHKVVNNYIPDIQGLFLYLNRLQEINTGVVTTALSFVEYDEWARSLMLVLSKLGFFMVSLSILKIKGFLIFFE